MKKGWEIKKLGEVCELYQPSTISIKEMIQNGSFPVFGANGIIGRYNKYNHEEPQLLITCRGATCGAVNISEPKSWINGNAMVVRPKENVLLLKFIEYFFRGPIDLTKAITGAAQPQITRQSLFPIEINFPKSITEQERIVFFLDEAFEKISIAKSKAEQNLKNTQELFESYLEVVFEKKGDGWEERSLEDVVDEKCTLSYGIVQPGEEYYNGLPIIRPTDLTKRYICLEGLKKINPQLAEGYKRTKLIGDELLLCVRGTTGVISIATKELEGANVTRGIVPIRFDQRKIDQEFGYYLLNSKFIQKQIQAKTYGAALMQINIGDLRKIRISYPSVKEQKSLIKELDILLDKTQKLTSIYQQKIVDFDELKKSLLQKAFSGELN